MTSERKRERERQTDREGESRRLCSKFILNFIFLPHFLLLLTSPKKIQVCYYVWCLHKFSAIPGTFLFFFSYLFKGVLIEMREEPLKI